MGMFARGRAMLNRVLKEQDPVPVTYTRSANGETLAMTGRLGRQVAKSEVNGKSVLEYGDADIIIAAADLSFGGVVVEPAEGDRVAAEIGGRAVVFDVLPRFGEPAWRYSDPQRTMIRLHCKEVG